MKKDREGSRIFVLAIMPEGSFLDGGEAWTVQFCPSVSEAIALLSAGRKFAAVVLDREAAGTAWQAAVGQLAGLAPTSRVLLASTDANDGLWQRVVEHGGQDVLTKPFRLEEVRRAIFHAHWYSTAIS